MTRWPLTSVKMGAVSDTALQALIGYQSDARPRKRLRSQGIPPLDLFVQVEGFFFCVV
jgi:hypothetical protein